MSKIHAFAARCARWTAPVLALAVAACNNGSSHHNNNPGTSTVATVSSTIPPASASNVATNRKVAVTFDRDMDDSTITVTTFTVSAPGAVPVVGTVAYDSTNRSATFTPVAAFWSNTIFTAKLSTSIADASGRQLENASDDHGEPSFCPDAAASWSCAGWG